MAGARQTSDFRPHIYTPAEIQALLAEAGRLPPAGSLRPQTFVTLIGLLYCTGIRIAEALALRLADVDLEEGLVIIRPGKFPKSRAVPFQPDVTRALAEYLDMRRLRRHRCDARPRSSSTSGVVRAAPYSKLRLREATPYAQARRHQRVCRFAEYS